MKRNDLFLSLIAVCLITSQSCCIIWPSLCPLQKLEVEIKTVVIKAAIKSNDPNTSWQDPIGFQAGIGFPSWSINEQISLISGGLISFQGAGWKEGDLEGRVNLLYGYVPVMLKYQHSSGFYGEAGLQPGFLFSAKDKYEGITESYLDHMNRFDLSIPLIIGYKFENNIGVNLRVIPGINDITKEGDKKDRNFVMGLGLSYYFNLRK